MYICQSPIGQTRTLAQDIMLPVCPWGFRRVAAICELTVRVQHRQHPNIFPLPTVNLETRRHAMMSPVATLDPKVSLVA